MKRIVVIIGSIFIAPIATALVAGQEPEAKPEAEAAAKEDHPEKEKPPERVIKSEREWARILTRQQFMVTRLKATEPAFTGKYVNNHAKGTYHCVGCDAELFSSLHKFDSGTGWPSFYRPMAQSAMTTEADFSDGSPRTEVMCSRCGAHLGHIFDDGPPPTGLRYCINSVSLRFVKDGAKAESKKPSAKKGATRAKAKPKAKQAKAAGKPAGDPTRPESP